MQKNSPESQEIIKNENIHSLVTSLCMFTQSQNPSDFVKVIKKIK